MRASLAITGVGLLSPIGQLASVCMHSVRSGSAGLSVMAYPDRAKEWICGGRLLRWTAYGGQRHWRSVLKVALSQAWRQASTAPSFPPSGAAAMIIGKPEPMRPGKLPLDVQSLPREWLDLEGLPEITHVEQVQAGSCNAHAALFAAARLFSTSSVRMCFIGVADSQLDIRTTRWHEQNYRLKCSYNADGLMPAEAACFLVVEPEEAAAARGAPVIARILSMAGGREEASVLSDQPNTAAALTEAVRTALTDAGVSAADIGMVWSDLNGESIRAREWAFTEIRLGFRQSTQLLHPADCHGDLGAATDANLLGLAALCHGTGWSQQRPLLVFSGSEGGLRAATVLAPGIRGFLQVSAGLPRILSSEFRLPEPPDDDYASARDPLWAYFEWRLREGHLDDLASLHYQRRAILKDGTLPWSRLSDPEQRILNHIDAAVASGPDSMAAVADGLKSDEEGPCFAGAFMLGVLPSRENFSSLATALDRPTPARLAGIEAALSSVPSSEALSQLILDHLEHRDASVRAMSVRVAARRRMDIGGRVRSLFGCTDSPVLTALAQASWRLGLRDCAPRLGDLLGHESEEVRRSALVSLMVLAPDAAVSFCRSHLDSNDLYGGALARCLGIAGRLANTQILIERSHVAPAEPSVVEALGVLGAPSACPRLIELLGSTDEKIKIAAGNALDLMSGLHATERVAVPRDPDDPDWLQTREVQRVRTSQGFWSAWWEAQRHLLDVSNARWRRGAYHNLGLCIAELADPRSTLDMRERAFMELAVHGDSSIPYEPDWFAARQTMAIDAWKAWWRELSRAEELIQ